MTIDINKDMNNNYTINNYEAKNETECVNFIKLISSHKVGEIIINCVFKDGTKEGYDLNLIDLVYPLTDTPLTIVGGAKSYEEIVELSNKYPILGFGVGNLFIYKGKNKAVLISYPKEHSKKINLNKFNYQTRHNQLNNLPSFHLLDSLDDHHKDQTIFFV